MILSDILNSIETVFYAVKTLMITLVMWRVFTLLPNVMNKDSLNSIRKIRRKNIDKKTRTKYYDTFNSFRYAIIEILEKNRSQLRFEYATDYMFLSDIRSALFYYEKDFSENLTVTDKEYISRALNDIKILSEFAREESQDNGNGTYEINENDSNIRNIFCSLNDCIDYFLTQCSDLSDAYPPHYNEYSKPRLKSQKI